MGEGESLEPAGEIAHGDKAVVGHAPVGEHFGEGWESGEVLLAGRCSGIGRDECRNQDVGGCGADGAYRGIERLSGMWGSGEEAGGRIACAGVLPFHAGGDHRNV